MSFSKLQASFSSNFAWHFTVMKDYSSVLFLGQALYTFRKRNQWMCKFLRLLSARIKIHQVLVIFKTTNCFFFKFCITLHCHEIQLPCTFLAEISYNFNKRSLSKYKFGETLCEQLKEKEPPQVQVWWNFAWVVEYMKFWTLMGSFCPNQINFQLKTYRRVISYHTEEWFKV